jgi:gliding motility-associated-like protein
VNLYVNPFNHPPSDYQWSSNGLNNGNPFIWPYDPLSVDFTGAPLNDYIFYVREINYGCYGPYSGKATLTIIGKPHVSISGPVQVCLGDTVTYNVGYLKDTYYNWDAPAGVKVFDEANSQVTMIFDSVGTFTISNFTLNDCGGDSGFYTVKVITLFSADAGADKKICDGDSVQLHVETSALDKLFVTSDTATTGKQGAMFNIIARFDVTIDSFAVKYLSTQPIQAEIWGKNHTYKSFEQSQFTWYQLGGYYNFAPNPIGQFTVIPFWVNQFIPAGDTFAFYVTTANTPAINEAISPGNGPTGTTYKTDGIIDYVQGTANSYPFGAFIGPRVLNVRIYYTTKAGLSYLWNTGDSVATIWAKPSLSSLYSVVAYDTSGCKNRDSVFVQVNARPTVNAGTDTVICEGESYILNATSSVQHVVWMSSNELSDLNSLTPTYNYNSSSPDSVFIITAIIDSSQCAVSDTVIISPKNCKAYIVVPGAFTPNNDGHNDYFTIFGNNIEQYELRIFNRWGEEVYNTHDAGELNDLSRGWDGSFKGKLQDTGTFVYYLTAKDAYGHHYEKKGNLELIR